jgi:dUTP pyrophosphatase
MDLYSIESYKLEPKEMKIFELGIAVEISSGYTALVKDKSSLAADHKVHALAGVIDAGYRGEWKTPLINLGNEEVQIKKGQNIAQAIVLPIPEVEVQTVDSLSESERGEGGFGSTGKF